MRIDESRVREIARKYKMLPSCRRARAFYFFEVEGRNPASITRLGLLPGLARESLYVYYRQFLSLQRLYPK
jgi:hypothetical protein